MDLLATAIIARSLGRVRWKRVALAAAVGASWAALAQLGALRFLGSLPALAALSLLMAAVAIPPDSLRTALVSGAALLGGGVFLGGVQLAALRLFRGAGTAAFFAGRAAGRGGAAGGYGAAQKAAGDLGGAGSFSPPAAARRASGRWWTRETVCVNRSAACRCSSASAGCSRTCCRRATTPCRPAARRPAFGRWATGALGGGGRMNCFRPERAWWVTETAI